MKFVGIHQQFRQYQISSRKKNYDLTRTDLIFSATHSKTTVVYFLEIAEYLDKGMETLFIH